MSRTCCPSYLVESILFWALETVFVLATAGAEPSSERRGPAYAAGPTVNCPGDPENFVDERLDDERRMLALVAVEAALAHVEEDEAADDVGTALDASGQDLLVLLSQHPAPTPASSLRRYEVEPPWRPDAA